MSIKGQGHSLTLATGHSDFITFFSNTIGSFETKFGMKVYWRMGMKIYTNELGHMTKMAAMPIYSKKPLKSYFSRSK